MPEQGQTSVPARRKGVNANVIGLMRMLSEVLPPADSQACPSGPSPSGAPPFGTSPCTSSPSSASPSDTIPSGTAPSGASLSGAAPSGVPQQSVPSSRVAASRNHSSSRSAPEVVDLTMAGSDEELVVEEGQEDAETEEEGGDEITDDIVTLDDQAIDELMDVQGGSEGPQASEGVQVQRAGLEVEEPPAVVQRVAEGGLITEFSGDVRTSPLCAEGEVRVLGHTLVGPAYRLFCQLQESCRSGLLITMDGEKYDESIVRVMVKSARHMLLSARCEGQGIWSGGVWLPAELECKGCFIDKFISRFDHRRMLAGQRGLFAEQRIPKNCVLGPYRCLTLPERFFDSYLDDPPPKWDAYTQGRCSHPRLVWKYLVSCYAADADVMRVKAGTGEHCPKKRKISHNSTMTRTCTSPPMEEKIRLTMSAFGYGNKTSLVNDHHMDPWGFSWSEDRAAYRDLPCETSREYREARLGKTAGKPNVDIVPMYLNGFPFLFLVSIRKIEPGEELLYDYGYEYWDCLKPLSDQLDASDKALVKNMVCRR